MVQGNSGATRILLLAAFALLAFAGSAHADCPTCEPGYTCCKCDNSIPSGGFFCMGSADCESECAYFSCTTYPYEEGTCSGGPASCDNILGGEFCCGTVPGCNLVGDDCASIWASLPCSTFNNQKTACINAGCDWTPSCVGTGELCGASSSPPGKTCCSGTCVPDDDGIFMCAPPCNPFGSYCDPVAPNCCANTYCKPMPSSYYYCLHACSAAGEPCMDDDYCCTGMVCSGSVCVVPSNQPPEKPQAPQLSPSLILVNGVVSCTNCATLPIPPDQDNIPPSGPVTLKFQWYRKTGASYSALTGWITSYASFICTAYPGTCQIGNGVAMRARAYDGNGLGSEPSDYSNTALVVCSQEGEYCDTADNCCSSVMACEANQCIVPEGTPITGELNLIYIIFAILSAILVLALAYMASYAFSLPSLRAIVQDELVQVLATGAIAFMLLALLALVNDHLTGILAATADESGAETMIEAAYEKLGGLSGTSGEILANMQEVNTDLGHQASKAIFCNFLGTGFSIVNCSPLNAFRGSLTLGYIATAMGEADLFAQRYILSLAQNFAFTLIIPLGLFLRCFKMTRMAGGALISLGFGFYAVYPTVIVATDNSLHGETPPASPSKIANFTSTTPKDVFGHEIGCDPTETDVSKPLEDFNNYSDEITGFPNNERLAYFVLVRVVFMSILNLIITLGFIRAFAHIIGSEIDVSSLSRIS